MKTGTEPFAPSRRYGYAEDAYRLAVKYCDTVELNFDETGNLWENYNMVTGKVSITRGGLANYNVRLERRRLSPLRRALRALINPSHLSNKKGTCDRIAVISAFIISERLKISGDIHLIFKNGAPHPTHTVLGKHRSPF